MADLLKEDLPRERLRKRGSASLSLAELLAIVLSSGAKGKPVLHLAQDLLSHFDGLEGLFDASIEELCEFTGIGTVKAIEIKALGELVKRSFQKSLKEEKRLSSPKDAFQFIQQELVGLHEEHLFLILRDVKGRAYRKECISKGSTTDLLVQPYEIFQQALRQRAKSIIVVHNHPSGDLRPSLADIEWTKHLLLAGEILSISLDDHLIVDQGNFFSFWQTELIQGRSVY